MLAIDLLRQMDSSAPLVDYIRWQVERREEAELLDAALEASGPWARPPCAPPRWPFWPPGTRQEALLDLLVAVPGDEDVFAFALKGFQTHKDKRALYAGYLAKLEDDRALEALLDVAEGSDVSYIDFIEIRSAIERLGGEAPIRDFSADPTYKAVKRLQ